MESPDNLGSKPVADTSYQPHDPRHQVFSILAKSQVGLTFTGVCVYVDICEYVYVDIYVHVCMHMSVHMYVLEHAFMYIHMHVHVYASMCVCMYCARSHMCLCMHDCVVCIYVC